MAPFCGDPLWDTNLTWNTDSPELTECFQETVLVYAPAAVILLFLPLQLLYIKRSRDRGIPWTFLNVARALLTFGLVIVAVVDLAFYIDLDKRGSGTVNAVYYVSAAVRILMFAVALAVSLLCKKHGIVAPALLFYYWTAMLICDAFSFASTVARGLGPGVPTPRVTAVVQFAFVATVWFLTCWADPKPRHIELSEDIDDMTPERYASTLSKLTFSWMDALTLKGWKNILKTEDMYSLMIGNRCSGVIPVWDRCWEREVERAGAKGRPLSILPTLAEAFGWSYSYTTLLNVVISILQFASPQIVSLLINFVTSDEPTWRGYFYTVLIVAVTLLTTFLNVLAFYQEYLVGLRVRSALISAIYRKSLKLSNAARREMTVGETTNLMQIDTQKFMDLALYLNFIALSLYFLWDLLGPSTLTGVAVLILLFPLNGVLYGRIKKLQVSQMRNKDKRTKLVDEILNGMKILKMYAWEMSFVKKVNEIRNTEIVALKKMAYYYAVVMFILTCSPIVIMVVSFASFVLTGGILDPNTAFVSVTLFNLLRAPFTFLPILLVYLVQVHVSMKRLNKYMNSDELDLHAVSHENTKEAVVVKDGVFKWERESDPVLKDINISIGRGELVAVVGSVGSGKSSLLSALLGEMDVVSGRVNTSGRIAYVPQQAWIQNGTVKYNINFGKPFDHKLYDKVLGACALKPDLKMLPGGDQTEIGEKGINLSGGQKQRVSMARAAYNGGSLFLLDDPLSAVDAHVGVHIFDNVIGNKGMLRGKTRILVTHSAKYLPQVDKIIVMKNGAISEMGSYRELLKASGEFADFLIEYLNDEEEGEDGTEDGLDDLKHQLEEAMGRERFQRQMSIAKSQRTGSRSEGFSERGEPAGKRPPRRTTSMTEKVRRDSHVTSVSGEGRGAAEGSIVQAGQNLIEEEKVAVGGVSGKVYSYYVRSVGLWMTLSSLLSFVAYQAFSVASSIWLDIWTTDPEAITDPSVRDKYLGIYGLFGILQSVGVMVGTVILNIACLNAAVKLHTTMLTNVLRSPMSFFDTTPLGRILNRFSKDIDMVDVTIPAQLRSIMSTLLTVVGTIVVICYTSPIFIVIVIPIGLIFWLIQRIYIKTARQVKRLESITRSPIYSHFGETISGAPSIRAYNATARFISTNEEKIDINQTCYYPTFVANRWLAVRLEVIGNLVIFFAALFAVVSRNKLDGGDVGLSLSYSLTVTQYLSWLVTQMSEIETNMVGVERIKEYQETTQEAPLEMPGQDPPPEWPQRGHVRFDDFQVRYRPGLDLVLKGIDCEIRSMEKIGIVGRTGAGKSSLTLALFRIIESAGGSITIDGENIALMGLQRLRSRLTIIPQDPVLFTGSLRMNLDPFEEYGDRDIWKSLEQAHLKSYVSNLPNGLRHEVTEGGDNLSVGQRQLVCLARALLRKTKVLVLDEATAAVDLETDDLIQDTIRKEFADCTVLTIAHRLNTIMDSSRIMVLDAGRVVEFDTPENLLRKTDTIFYGMAKESGLEPKIEVIEEDLLELTEADVKEVKEENDQKPPSRSDASDTGSSKSEERK